MNGDNIIFAIPTYRLRDVGETIEKYDENFWRNGYSLKIVVFDDSSTANFRKYYHKLEQTETYNDVFYVGPNEKGQFSNILLSRLGENLESQVNSLFRPSYGGNRNFTLIYSLGNLMISADDDMRPEGLISDGRESLLEGEICRGKMVADQNGYSSRSYDILGSFLEVLGKKVGDVPSNYLRGELVLDNAMDLETNTTTGLKEENSLMLKKGRVPNSSIVKIAQTFRTGTNDIDAIDYAEMFLRNETQTNPDELKEQYVIMNFRPVITNKNWRMDSGVAGYDNRHGLPPFFPTRLRFEDYIFRIWIQQKGIVSAHVDAVQRHIKNNYMRDPLASDIFNEEISNFLKKKIKSTITHLDELNINFDYDGLVSEQESKEILEKIIRIYDRTLQSAKSTQNEERQNALYSFAANLNRVFYGFELDFFQQNLSRIIDDEIGLIKSSLGLWQTLVEICYFHKAKQELPQTQIKNKKKGSK